MRKWKKRNEKKKKEIVNNLLYNIITMISEADRELLKRKRIEIVDNCHKCNGFGYVFSEECECIKRFNFEYEKVKANIPFIYRNYTLDDIGKSKFDDVKKVKAYIKNIDSNKKKSMGLLISGGLQVGKATIACVTLMELLKKGYKKCDFLEFQYLMKELYKQSKHAYTDEDLDYRINNAEFLVINGISSEYCAYSEHNILETNFKTIIKNRISLGYPTILTSTSINDKTGNSIHLKEELGDIFGKNFQSLLSKYFIDIRL